MRELRRCPFCGGEAKIVNIIGTFNDEPHEQWRIRCKNIDCDVKPSTSWFNNEEEAIDRWNRRKTIDEIVEQLEECKTKKYVTGITHNPYELGACHAMDDAIEIVKGLDGEDIPIEVLFDAG